MTSITPQMGTVGLSVYKRSKQVEHHQQLIVKPGSSLWHASLLPTSPRPADVLLSGGDPHLVVGQALLQARVLHQPLEDPRVVQLVQEAEHRRQRVVGEAAKRLKL